MRALAAHIIGALLRFLIGAVRILAGLAIRHHLAALVVFAALVAVVIFYRRTLSRSAQSRRRARALREGGAATHCSHLRYRHRKVIDQRQKKRDHRPTAPQNSF